MSAMKRMMTRIEFPLDLDATFPALVASQMGTLESG